MTQASRKRGFFIDRYTRYCYIDGMASVCDYCSFYASSECGPGGCGYGDCAAEIYGHCRSSMTEDDAKSLASLRFIEWRREYWRTERRTHPISWVFRWIFVGNPLEKRAIYTKIINIRTKIHDWNMDRLRKKGYVIKWKWNKDRRHGKWVMVPPEKGEEAQNG